jgi:hypothetical protein
MFKICFLSKKPKFWTLENKRRGPWWPWLAHLRLKLLENVKFFFKIQVISEVTFDCPILPNFLPHFQNTWRCLLRNMLNATYLSSKHCSFRAKLNWMDFPIQAYKQKWPRGMINITFVNDNKVILHAKYLSNRHFREEILTTLTT